MQIRIRIDVSRLFWHISFRTTPTFADVTTFYTYPEPTPTRAALLSEVVFMTGLALGRLLSLLVDGIPSLLLIIYLLLEVSFAAIGVYLLRQSTGENA